MTKIHPTAIISSKAQLDDTVEIGPFCIVEDDVTIGKNNKLLSHVVIYKNSKIGENNIFHQGNSIGNIPQDLKFGGEVTDCIIGNNNTFREFVTIHRGTSATKKTEIRNNCFFMSYVHVAHDCFVDDGCILANAVQLGGHSHLEEMVIVGGVSGVHQFTQIGKHAMIGGASRIVQDIMPYGIYGDQPLKCSGINLIGLRRRGFSNESLEFLRKAFSFILDKKNNTNQAIELIKSELKQTDEIKTLLEFISKSKRGIVK